jgi:RHS repeat-associated protein
MSRTTGRSQKESNSSAATVSVGWHPAASAVAVLWCVVVIALLGPAVSDAQPCYIPYPGQQAVNQTLKDSATQVELTDGMTVPLGSYSSVIFHQWGSAYGYCEVYTPNCETLVNTDQRGVSQLATTLIAHTQGFLNGTYYPGHVYGKNSSGAATVYPNLDDSDSTHSTGPIAPQYIFNPGRYTFVVTNVIYPTSCVPIIQPTSILKTITVTYESTAVDKNLGCHAHQNDGPSKVGDPCDIATGNEYQREADYASETLPLVRHYNSLSVINAGLGVGWMTAYHRRLEIFGNSLRVRRGDGSAEPFTLVNGLWQGDPDTEIAVVQGLTGFTLTVANGDAERYDLSGKLQSVTGRTGKVWTWSYDAASGLLSTVTDSFGNTLTFQYGSTGLVSAVTLPGGTSIQYGYDSNQNLTSATYPDNTTRQYLYENTAAATQNQLTGIIDESGNRYATFTYSSGQVTVSQHAGGAEKVSLSYGYSSTAVTDALGVARTYNYQNILNAGKTTAVSGTYCSQCGGAKSVTYDGHGNPISRSDFNNVQTVYSYDLTRNLETSRTEAYGTGRARTITTQWNSSWRVPQLITEPGRTTAFTYDSGGNPLTKTITDTSVTPNVSRTWTYTYDGYGHVLTVDGPRTDVSDVTTFTYYACTTGSECGQLHTATNPMGQATTYNTYNVHGQPLTITDPNGVVTTLTYDARQHLISRQVGTETTSFEYWPTGQLKKMTLPDASYLFYTYDAAHRLTQVSDGVGNSIDYTLDAMGNRTAENVYDPSNTLHRTHSRVFNTLNQLYQDVNAAGTAAVTTTFGYDNNGNQTSIAAPLSRNTVNTYDEFNRLKQVTDPMNGVTKFSYDANSNLTSVVDPRSLKTTYTYNGFGNLSSQTSPDTGTTTNTYDLAGNLATSTDARGALATYTYDPLNRLTSIAYSLGGSTDQTISFSYDTGSNGKSHLTSASDSNHSMSWSYDGLGRVTAKSQVIGGIVQSVAYTYTSGNLTSLTTPSGQTVTYGYNANHQVTSVAVNGTTVLNSVTYEPLGPLSGWSWGNGTTTSRMYDTDGKIAQVVSAGTKTFSYDDAFRITGISDTSSGAVNWTYAYDTLDRITSGTSATVTRGWTYDANGNRLTETGSAPSTYAISPTSNQITGITGALARTYGYDAAGNATGYATVTATYNDAGRLKTLTQGGYTETVVYNALGQRIAKSGGTAGTVLYGYDEAEHLLGEYDATGALIEETVWLGDTPVATLRPNGASVSIYYLHSDQLNTPRQVTRPSDNVQMWTWFSDPFGTDAANSNPVGAGTFAYNLRFPGQIFDGQAGLHQNMARDYDPAVGRYAESDPIGLKGGSYAPYVYARTNPITNSDPSGLLTQGAGWTGPTSAWDWADVKAAEARIRQVLSHACSCRSDGSAGSCIPCNLVPDLLDYLTNDVVNYSIVLPRHACASAPNVSPYMRLSAVAFYPERCGCLASTIYHELLHNYGWNHTADPAQDPVNAAEAKCEGELCGKNSPVSSLK